MRNSGFSPKRNRQLPGWIAAVLWVLMVFPSAGQERKLPRGRINKDTVRTGESFAYSLSYRHAPGEEVFFPDSTFDFSPFEFRRQEVFSTETDETGSLDSAVYHLVSFEVTSGIGISLPVFLWNGKDCTAVYPPVDSSFVALLVDRAKLDSLTLAKNLEVVPIKERFDYSAFLIGLLIAAITAFLINWLFGKKIRQQWNVFRLKRRHREFSRGFNRYFANAKNRGSTQDVEKALILWKNYLERLESKPFTTFTTREISDNISDDSLREALKETDKIIYGVASQSTDIGNSLLILNNVAQTLYNNKRLAIMGVDRSQREIQ